MAPQPLTNTVRLHRQARGLSQQALAELVGISRQGIIAIEAGRQVPSTVLSLKIARTLQCQIEQLFQLTDPHQIEARWAPAEGRLAIPHIGTRVYLGWIHETWVAHPLPAKDTRSADGVIVSLAESGSIIIEPFHPIEWLQNSVLVAGCAPILSVLAQRFPLFHTKGRLTWLSTSSQRALDLLQQGCVHVAGIHLLDADFAYANQETVQQRFPDQRMQMVHLTRWRQGWLLPQGNPKGFLSKEDLLRPGLRIAHRPKGAGAQKLIQAQIQSMGANIEDLSGPMAIGHTDVARLIEVGAADVGLAIESEALSSGLEFIPLTEERFDLITTESLAQNHHTNQVLESVGDRQFRRELLHIPGYDSALTGQAHRIDGVSSK